MFKPNYMNWMKENLKLSEPYYSGINKVLGNTAIQGPEALPGKTPGPTAFTSMQNAAAGGTSAFSPNNWNSFLNKDALSMMQEGDGGGSGSNFDFLKSDYLPYGISAVGGALAPARDWRHRLSNTASSVGQRVGKHYMNKGFSALQDWLSSKSAPGGMIGGGIGEGAATGATEAGVLGGGIGGIGAGAAEAGVLGGGIGAGIGAGAGATAGIGAGIGEAAAAATPALAAAGPPGWIVAAVIAADMARKYLGEPLANKYLGKGMGDQLFPVKLFGSLPSNEGSADQLNDLLKQTSSGSAPTGSEAGDETAQSLWDQLFSMYGGGYG
jgi:hypothetical protein